MHPLAEDLERKLAEPVPTEGIAGAFYRQRRRLMEEVMAKMLEESQARQSNPRRKRAA